MRINLDSASEASADEHSSLGPIQAGPSSSTADHNPSAADTPKRRGILRNPSSQNDGLVTSARQSAQRFGLEHEEHEDQDLTPRRRQSSLAFQRRQRSATPAFELVGVSSPSRSPAASTPHRPAPSSSLSQERLRSAPAWMRSAAPRSTQVDAANDSSEEDRTYNHRAPSSDSEYDTDSDEDSGSSPTTSSLDDEDDFSDSEEDEWPVDPSAPSAQRRSSSKSRQKARSRIKVSTMEDEWEEWNRAASQTAWERARRRLSARPQGLEGANTPEGGPISPLYFKGSAILPSSMEQRKSQLGADIDEVRALLSSLNMRRADEEKKAKDAFDARNRVLWQGIDASILAAEKEAKEAQAAEAARLEAVRKAQEEAERKARERREEELKKIEAEKQAQQAEADRKTKAAQEEEKQRQAAKEQEEKEKSMGGSGVDIRRAAEKEYENWMAQITNIKENILPKISQNPDLRKQCFTAKRQITPKVSQLTNSRQEIVRITEAIGSVLSAAKQASATGEIYTWILNHLSKCLIRQAEQEVAAKQNTAYPLARVVVWLLLQGYKELGDVLMARLVKKCPWVLAVWPPRKPDVDEQTYRKLLGYKGSDETTENYSNRMCGIFAFYGAILQTSPSNPPGVASVDLSLIPEHMRPKAIWIWCVRSLTPSSPFLGHPLAPSFWSTLLEVAGNRALGIYGKQMQKLFHLMLDQGLKAKKADFTKKESEGNVKAAMVRLELLLEGWAKDGRITDATKGSEMEP